jgi:hypothetical protein
MNRSQKRIIEAETAAIIRKAKKDMEQWISSLQSLPSEHDIRIWQAGYISGINRGAQQNNV